MNVGGAAESYIGPTLLRDIDVEGLAKSMETYTEAGAAALKARLSQPISDSEEIAERQNQLRGIRSLAKTTDQRQAIAGFRKTLKETEADVRTVGACNTDTRHAEYYTQILWASDSQWAWMNHLGWLNELIVLFRTILLPGLSVVLPLFVFLAPLIFFNVMTKEPLTFDKYLTLLQTSLKKAMPPVLGAPRFAGTGGILEFGEQFFHIGVSVAMFGASIWSQVSAALSMRAVVADMRRRSNAVLAFSKATAGLAAALGQPLPAIQWSEGELGVFGDAWNQPARIQDLLAAAGNLDMLAAVALAKRTCFPNLPKAGPKADNALELTDLYHPGLQEDKRIYNSLTLDATTKQHVMLTGPNRGGKSTLLKAVGAAVLMAQTVGVVFAKKAALPIFENIITALSPQDVMGSLSLFEAEIEFAKDVKARLAVAKGPTFLMMDEIFHGTNAHDGVEASQVFLDGLYESKASVFSIVSTHYMDLPKRYGSSKTQNLCMDASVDPNDSDRLIYTYRLKAGVNGFSSVREILRERGLLVSVKALVAKLADEPVKPVKPTGAVLTPEKTPVSE
jgi:energy-coupling factor transporter ATP-binding protein EcfA2